MADRIERNIFVTKNKTAKGIDYVQGASMVPIALCIQDYGIPEGAEARVYVLKPSGCGEYDTASLEGDTILIDVKGTMFDEVGTHYIQASVEHGGETLITFEVAVEVSGNLVPGEVPQSGNSSNFLDEYLSALGERMEAAEQLVEDTEAAAKNANDAADSVGDAAENANTAAENANTAAENANAAADNADTAARNADEVADSVGTAAENANTAAGNANTAAENANAAAEAYRTMFGNYTVSYDSVNDRLAIAHI